MFCVVSNFSKNRDTLGFQKTAYTSIVKVVRYVLEVANEF